MKLKPLTDLVNMSGDEAIDWIIENQYDYFLIKQTDNNGQIEAEVKVQIAGIVKDIMQEGFEIAMGGNMDLSEEANRREQTARYDRAIKNYTKIIISNLSA